MAHATQTYVQGGLGGSRCCQCWQCVTQSAQLFNLTAASDGKGLARGKRGNATHSPGSTGGWCGAAYCIYMVPGGATATVTPEVLVQHLFPNLLQNLHSKCAA